MKIRPLLLALLLMPSLASATGLGITLDSSRAMAGSEKPAEPGSQSVIIEAHLSSQQAWELAEVQLTLRILHSIPLYDDTRLQLSQTEDLRIEKLGEPRNYETRINDQRHGVIEQRYALFPQRSGHFALPLLQFTATALISEHEGEPARPRRIQLSSPPLALEVRQRPADYPAGHEWLPASSLDISERWTPEPLQVHIGDSLTRHLRIQASGITASLLPEPGQLTGSGPVRPYREPPVLQDTASASGLQASREDNVALVFTEAGKVELPAIELPWWNTRANRLEWARLPARTIEVLPDPLRSGQHLQTRPLALLDEPAPVLLWPWQLATLLLGCTSLLGFGLWLRARRPAGNSRPAAGPSQRSLLDELRRQCQANDPQASRQALDAWARQQPETLAQMAARDIALSDALDELNACLYAQTAGSWDGHGLWLAVTRLLSSNRQGNPEADSLPPLYPD